MSHKHPFFGWERRGYHHGRLKDALIEAARSLVAERGLAGFTLAEAAKRVGVTAAAPYRHFADRNDLMGELARRGFEMFGERLLGAWDEGRPDPRQALRRMGSAYLAFARAEPGLYTAMFENIRHLSAPGSGVAADRALDTLQRAATAALASLGGPPADARKLAHQLWSLSHGIATLTLAGHLSPTKGADPAALLESAAMTLMDAALGSRGSRI